MGGGDPTGNPRLRQLMDKAKEVNMPQENVTRAIKKGTGELPGVNYEAITYEGYGPSGIAVLVDVLTDNKNRAVAEMRHIFSKKGGSLGETGCVAWMFETLGVVRVKGNTSEDQLLEQLLDFDIKDIYQADDLFVIQCDPKSVDEVKKAVEKLGLTVEDAEIEKVPKNTLTLSGEESQKAIDFLTALDELDDVQNIYTNLG